VATRKSDRRTASRRLEYIYIEEVTPELDGGRFPVKRIVGDAVVVGATILKEGHDHLGARALCRAPGANDWFGVPMAFDFDTDRWYGTFTVDRIGRWTFTVEGWTDRVTTWNDGFKKKLDAGQDVTNELLEVAQMARVAARGAKAGPARASLLMTAKMLEDRRDTSLERRVQRVLEDDFLTTLRAFHRPSDRTRYRHDLEITVDRPRARFAAWYEIFPRSSTTPGPVARHGTLADTAARLPRLAELGFDVVYLPPIHPIGRTFRKGKNNSLSAEPDDVGSPWAIGNENGGHTAIEPALGSIEDFDSLVETANRLGLEIALDYALQCSPDHPWVREHPEWFHIRPDGTIQYAENPPKKYQDIYPLNFWCADRQNLWNACRDVVAFWIEHGVKTFRVDNPHTKPFAFWEWMIRDIQRDHPDVVFFAEAFTRPKRMKELARIGFTMSYTYFTWKNSPWELREYFEELTQTDAVEYFRGNLFVNTPDILNAYLVNGGRPAFRIRLLLAATLLPLYGIYSGYELCENVPAAPGSEEYLDSEKYQLRPRHFDAPGNINADIARVNRLRREQPALQQYANLTFHTSENPNILFYRKAAREPTIQWIGGVAQPVPLAMQGLSDAAASSRGDVLVVVNTDPSRPQESMIHVPVRDMGLDEEQPYVVHDVLTGARYTWRGVRNYVRLDPAVEPGHVFLIEPEPPAPPADVNG
jgi:starch synthase (maltosyl-transferring)